MPFIQRVVKPKTRKGKRFLEGREPKLIENTKRAIFIRGANANNVVLQAMKDFSTLKKPNAVMFNKKNDLRPFEDPSSLEFFSQKNDASLFMFGSNNKKRPSNLVIGRLYDYHVLDMCELGIENFIPLKDFKVTKIPSGTKPMLLFAGEAFEQQLEYKRLQNLFIDFFRGPVIQYVRLQGLEHVIMFSATSEKIHFRSYRVLMKKSGTRVPHIEIEEIGPHMDFTLRRTKLASEDLFKCATKIPFQLKPKKRKNIQKDRLGSTLGRIHMERQDYSKLQTRKLKGLKKSQGEKVKGEEQVSDTAMQVSSDTEKIETEVDAEQDGEPFHKRIKMD